MSGHGHVTPNPAGSKARCGGPKICRACAIEHARKPKTKTQSRAAIRLALACSCGGTLRGTISAPLTDVFTLRDIFMSAHRDEGCAVTDTSEDVP